MRTCLQETGKPSLSGKRVILLLPYRGQALQVFDPVHYENHLGNRRGLYVVELHHQKPLTIGGHVPCANWNPMTIASVNWSRRRGLLDEKPAPVWTSTAHTSLPSSDL